MAPETTRATAASRRSRVLWVALAAISLSACGSPDKSDSGDDETVDGQNGSSGEPIQATELIPLAVKLGKLTVAATDLPPGARVDASEPARKRLLWIPRLGQAGDYALDLRDEAGTSRRVLEIAVTPISEGALQAGPPAAYHDGDLGFVFVHGMTNYDLCSVPEEVRDYWGAGPELIAPSAEDRTLACYDGSRRVPETAPHVAQQILGAACGRYEVCVVVTHSMGGLMLEHIMTSASQGDAGEHNEIYRAVQQRTLFVISIASSAGGSEVASLGEAARRTLLDGVIGGIADAYKVLTPAAADTAVDRATRVIAPMHIDPGTPFFMIPGFSPEVLPSTEEALLGNLGLDFIRDLFDGDKLSDAAQHANERMFNGATELATLDLLTNFSSRSDGLVALRSACGVQSGNQEDGPGHTASLPQHLDYCFNAPKKPRHYVWFLSTLNHFLVREPTGLCSKSPEQCENYSPVPEARTFVADPALSGLSAVAVLRQKLFEGR